MLVCWGMVLVLLRHAVAVQADAGQRDAIGPAAQSLDMPSNLLGVNVVVSIEEFEIGSSRLCNSSVPSRRKSTVLPVSILNLHAVTFGYSFRIVIRTIVD